MKGALASIFALASMFDTDAFMWPNPMECYFKSKSKTKKPKDLVNKKFIKKLAKLRKRR